MEADLRAIPGYPWGMASSTGRRRLAGHELSGHRRHARWGLIGLITAGALFTLVGFAFGSVRVLRETAPATLEWSEWRSVGLETWFIPPLAALAVAGLGPIVWRRRPFTGVLLGVAALVALPLTLMTAPTEVTIAVDGLTELGYLGLVLMGLGGAAMIVTEPILAALERGAGEMREPGLPVARVVR